MNKKFTKITEQDSLHDKLDDMPVSKILSCINNEDKKVAVAVEKTIPQIEALVNKIIDKVSNGGRLFYIGAGTSGRLGILDASECPPTFGVDNNIVIGLIAGGDKAIRNAVEFAEDSHTLGWKELKAHHIGSNDVVVGIAASGTTPYVIHTIEKCNTKNIITGCITSNPGSPLAQVAQFPIEVVVGPEFLTGSSRMKSGTAQKMILNMISTSLMIQLGRVKGNKMVDMQLSNHKLIDRGIKMIQNELGIRKEEALILLNTHKNVRTAINHFNESKKNQ